MRALPGLSPGTDGVPSPVDPAAFPIETRLYIALLEWQLFCARAELGVWLTRARRVLAGATPVSPKWSQYRSAETGTVRLRHLSLLADLAEQSPTDRWGRELRTTQDWGDAS